ncbi:MAG: ATP-binding cassette domain-containing protein, partial [Limisphaerales bacterium]
MESQKKKIEVSNLRLSYGSREVIHGISFEIYENEILGVIGPAQSGKTSLLRCINRTIEFIASAKVSGSVKMDGTEVQRQDVF